MSKKYFDVVAVDHMIEGGDEKRSPQIVVRLKIVDGPQKGTQKMYYGSLHENAVKYTFEALRSLGWTCNDVEKLEGLGSVVAVAVEDDNKYNGKVTRRIKFINPKTPRKLEAKNPAPKGFGSRFKALAANTKVDIDREYAKAPSKEELDAMTAQATSEPTPEISDNPFA